MICIQITLNHRHTAVQLQEYFIVQEYLRSTSGVQSTLCCVLSVCNLCSVCVCVCVSAGQSVNNRPQWGVFLHGWAPPISFKLLPTWCSCLLRGWRATAGAAGKTRSGSAARSSTCRSSVVLIYSDQQINCRVWATLSLIHSLWKHTWHTEFTLMHRGKCRIKC